MPDKGCSVCHASGNTPKRECLDCHREGQATSYAQVQSEESSVTIYPSSDASMTAGWTYTTTPAGGAFYSGVDAPYPPVDLTGYTTITTSTAGASCSGSAGRRSRLRRHHERPDLREGEGIQLLVPEKAQRLGRRRGHGLHEHQPDREPSQRFVAGRYGRGSGVRAGYEIPLRPRLPRDLGEPEDRTGLDGGPADRSRPEQPQRLRRQAHRDELCQQGEQRRSGAGLREGRLRDAHQSETIRPWAAASTTTTT